MHTSKVLRVTDFHYVRTDGSEVADFQAFYPHYHYRDRIGVVSPCLEDGVLYTAYALLSLATAFYDVLRADTEDFFDYPYHLALLDVDAHGVRTQHGRLPLSRSALGAPWGGLDVWPESNWIAATGTASGMLQAVFSTQLSHVFWPQDLLPQGDDARLPVHVQRLLSARLKGVYYYKTPQPTIAISVNQTVEDMVQRSLVRLPHEVTRQPLSLPGMEASFPFVESYRQVTVNDFLTTMAGCFTAA